MKPILGLLFSIILIQACQEYYNDPRIADGTEVIVIEGLITNEPGPYKIKITKTLPYNLPEGGSTDPLPVSNINVSIMDDAGITDSLTEQEPGVYYTNPEMMGEAGKTYVLRLITPEGFTYQSEPCTMGMPAGIDSVYAEPGVITTLEKNESGVYFEKEHHGINLYVDFHSSGNPEDFYKLETHVIKEASHLEWRQGRPAPPARPPFPTPVYCWEIPAVVNDKDLISNKKSETKTIKKRFMGFLTSDVISNPNEINDPSFLVGVIATTSLYTISERMYGIFTQLHTQTNPSNSIFDPIPTRMESNITCITEPSKNVLGYFNVAAVTKETRFISWSDTAVNMKHIVINTELPYSENCKSDIPPDFWIIP